MSIIRQARAKEDLAEVRDLFGEYLVWNKGRMNEEFGIKIDVETYLEDDMAKLDIFSPPDGRLLLAFEEAHAAGIACLKKLREDIGEIKRMYVRPQFRGKGLGRALLETIIQEAKEVGYPVVRLDSARFMKEAHALYRSTGFSEIDPYPESEIPPEFQKHWVFMERQL